MINKNIQNGKAPKLFEGKDRVLYRDMQKKESCTHRRDRADMKKAPRIVTTVGA